MPTTPALVPVPITEIAQGAGVEGEAPIRGLGELRLCAIQVTYQTPKSKDGVCAISNLLVYLTLPRWHR